MISIEQMKEADAQDYLRRLEEGDPVESFGCSIKGFFDVVCREESEIVWEVHQPNLLTDYGRRVWFYNNITEACAVFTSPIAEPPRADRYSLMDHSGQQQVMGYAYGSNDSVALTKTWSNTFGLPASNKTIAAVGLRYNSVSDANAYGANCIICYSLLTPAKIQTTSQTLEISYRLTLSATV